MWAEENTREALYAALRRKEVFATSGPRIKIRLFAGYDYEEDDSLAERYAKGVPMGAELHGADGRAPILVASALRDPSPQRYSDCKSSKVGLLMERLTNKSTMSHVQTVARWIRKPTVAQTMAPALI